MPALAPVVKVDGQLVSAAVLDALDSVRVDRALGLVGRTTFRFRDDKYAISGSGTFKLDTVIEVTIPAHAEDSTARTLFKGLVTGLAIEQGAEGTVELTVTADEALHKLSRASVQMAYMSMSYNDILGKMCREAGLKSSLVGDDATAMPYTLVTGSWLSFLDDFARRNNRRWYFNPTSDTLVVEPADKAPAGSPVTLSMAEDLQRFSVRTTSLDADKVSVSGWDDKQQQATNGESKPAAASRKESEFVTGSPGRGNTGSAVLRLSGTPPTSTTEARLMAQSRLEEGRSAAVTAQGTTLGNGRLDLATAVKIEGAGPASGTYVLSAVEHIYDRRGFRTNFTAGSHRPSGLVDLLDRRGDDSGFVRHQLVIGKVVDNKDPEKLGRVMVKFPTMEGTNVTSTWARTITPEAGSGRGFVFVPEVNDEVLVGFEHGDTRRPIVLGSLFSAKVGLPTKDQANVGSSGVDHRRITSRSGHIIDLDDTKGNEQVLLLHKAGHQVLMATDKLEVTTKNLPITLSNGNAKFAMAANGDITIEGLNVKITAKANLDVEGVQVTTTAKAKATVDAKAMLQVTSPLVSMEAKGIMELKGAMVKIN